jgi:hypothetical protein
MILITRSNETERKQTAAEIGAWENEGGALGRDSMDHHYGRRIEADRSWTIYHVFTGIPARVSGDAMTGLSRSDATRGMLRLNIRNAVRRRERIELSPFKTDTQTSEDRS